MERESERKRGRDREREIEREREENQNVREKFHTSFLYFLRKYAIFSVISFLGISKNKFRTRLLTVGRPIIRAF